MDWNQSRLSYYADFALVPFLCLAALITELSTHGPSATLFEMMAPGFAVWTFLEYWIHRSLFHWVMRREHWLHHIRPGTYVAAPAWLSGLLHVAALGLLILTFGSAVGTGSFLGLETGYLCYIATHDAIHHRKQKAFGWLRRKWEHHSMHHQGAEVNFGVFSHFWDKVFRTYMDPRIGGMFRGRRVGLDSSR